MHLQKESQNGFIHLSQPTRRPASSWLVSLPGTEPRFTGIAEFEHRTSLNAFFSQLQKCGRKYDDFLSFNNKTVSLYYFDREYFSGVAYHAGCLPQTYTCLQAQKVHDGYRGENGLKDTGYSFLFFSILLSGVSLVSSFNDHLGSPLTVRSGHHCSHVRPSVVQSVDWGSQKVQTPNYIINCKENACGQKCITRLKRGLLIKVFCHPCLVLFYKANDDRIYFKCFPLVLVFVAGVWLLLMNWARS